MSKSISMIEYIDYIKQCFERDYYYTERADDGGFLISFTRVAKHIPHGYYGHITYDELKYHYDDLDDDDIEQIKSDLSN